MLLAIQIFFGFGIVGLTISLSARLIINLAIDNVMLIVSKIAINLLG